MNTRKFELSGYLDEFFLETPDWDVGQRQSWLESFVPMPVVLHGEVKRL